MRIQDTVIVEVRGAVTALTLALGVAAGTAQPYPSAVLADHPIAYWRLQETSGAIAHDIAGSFNGGFTNVLLGQPGYISAADPTELAVAFGSPAGQSADSLVGGIPLDFASAGNTNFSVEAWVNGSGVSGAGIVGKGTGAGGEEFFLDCGGSGAAFRFYIRNAAGTAFNAGGTVVPDGYWHHLVGVCDEVNGQIYLYVDGKSNAVHSASGGIQTSPNPSLTIGARQSGSGTGYDLQFNGNISEVAAYSFALSPAQVLTHYFAAGIPPTITAQPPGAATVDEGSILTLVAAATGSPPLSYQWAANSIPLAGQTNATLSLTNVPASLNNGSLVLTVTNAYGSASTFTFLTVNSGAPFIVSDVQPLQLALYQGLPVTYSVVVTGTEPFYYQWLRNGTNLFGATASSYTLGTLLGTNTYSVVISNTFGGGSSTPGATATLVGVPAPTASYPARILLAQPVAFWRLDESSGATTANDYAGGHDGAYNSVQLGLAGYSSLFDLDTAAGFGSLAPTDSYMGETDNSGAGIPLIDFAQPQGSNGAFSVEAWVNGPPTQNTSGSAIVAKGAAGSEEFVMDASGPGNHFRFLVRKAGSAGTSAIFSGGSVAPDGNWHHLVGVFDEPNGAMYFYVDSVNMGTIGAIGGLGVFSSSVPVSIGAQSTGGSYSDQFVGTVDEVALYNYALSANEVAAHYNAAPIPPYFTSVPPTNVAAYAGQTVTLSASALGSGPMTNQWYINSSILVGQNSFSLVLTNVQPGTNTYTLRVSNAYGAATNLPGTVVQVPAGSGPPQLVKDVKPQSATLYAGQAITYSVVASGSAPLAYQWYFGAQPILNATGSSLSFASLNATNAGTYYCHISNSISSTNTGTATLAVVPAPTSPYSLTLLSDHPVAYYRLDETTGSSIGYDYAGGNNGYYSNAVLYGVSGCYGPLYDADTAASFGNSGVQNILLGASITNVDFAVPNGQNGAFSVEAWAKGPTGVNQLSGGGIVAKGVGNGDEQFALDAHLGFRFYVRNAAGVTVAGAQTGANVGGSNVGGNWQMDGLWHHLVGVCDQVNSNILLYVDGSLIGPNVITNGVVPPLVYALDQNHPSTGTNGVIYTQVGIREPSNAYYNANSVSIGSRNKNSTSPGYTLNFNGAVDEVALYNYALSPLQVSNHFGVAKELLPSLSVQLTNGHPRLTWSGGWVTATLLSATNLTGPWGTITNAASPYSVTNPATRQFYRLKLF